MIRERVIGLVKEAAEVNLRYSAVVLKLAREYVKEFDGVLRGGGNADSAAPAGAAAAPAPDRRPPILLMAPAGTRANGAFVLNNTAETELAVSLMVDGDLGAAAPDIMPSSFMISPRGSAVVRLELLIGSSLEIGRDYAGAIVAPAVSAPPVEFIVRRLPDEAKSGPARPRKAPPRRST